MLALEEFAQVLVLALEEFAQVLALVVFAQVLEGTKRVV